MFVPRFATVTVSQQTSGPGIYVVTVPNVTLTLDNFLDWSDPTAPLIVKNRAGDGAAITITTLGGSIDGKSSFVMTVADQCCTFTPYQNGNTWLVTNDPAGGGDIQWNAKTWGATGDGATDDTAAITAMNAAYNAIATFTGSAGIPPVKQGPGLYFPASQYKGTYTLTGTGNGWSVYGDGVASALVGGTINLNAYLAHAKYLSMWGSGTGSAITLGSITNVERIVEDVAIRNYNIGLQVTGAGAYDVITRTIIRSCQTGIEVDQTSGLGFESVEVNSCLGDNVNVKGSGEIKSLGLRAMAAGAADPVAGGGSGSLIGSVNLRLAGQSRATVFENYWTNLTATLANRRKVPITSVADNGSGGTRFYTSTVYTYTAIQAQNGAFVPSPYISGAYECQLSVNSAAAATTVTSMLAGATELLGSPVVSTGDRVAFAAALASAINARTGTTGYTASSVSSQAFLWVQAPDGAAAFFRTMVVTTTGGAQVVPDAYAWIDMGAQHDMVAGEDVMLTNYSVSGTPSSGFVTIAYAPLDSAPVVIGAHTNSHIMAVKIAYSASTGTAVRPNRLTNGLAQGLLYCTGYTSGNAISISAVDHHYFEASNIPYAGVTNPAGSNYMTMPGWDVLVDSYDLSTRTADQFFIGGNINYLCIRIGYNIQLWGTRVKCQFWIDPRLNSVEKVDRVLWAASGRSAGKVLPFGSLQPDGATSGWYSLLINDDDSTPGNGRFTMISPSGTRGVYNEVGLTESAIVRRLAGQSLDITSLQHPLGANSSNSVVHAAVMSDATDTGGIRLNSAATGLGAQVSAYSTLGGSQRVDLNLFAVGTSAAANIYANAVRVAQFLTVASGVNFLTFAPAVTGSGPAIGTSGGDGVNATPVRFSAPVTAAGQFSASNATQTITANGQTITIGTAVGSVTLTTALGAPVTGLIVAAGTTAGQQLTLINSSSSTQTMTFAAAGTSRVAGGVSITIAVGRSLSLTWDGTSLWYSP